MSKSNIKKPANIYCDNISFECNVKCFIVFNKKDNNKYYNVYIDDTQCVELLYNKFDDAISKLKNNHLNDKNHPAIYDDFYALLNMIGHPWKEPIENSKVYKIKIKYTEDIIDGNNENIKIIFNKQVIIDKNKNFNNFKDPWKILFLS